tara:strand:- start:192 stop:407 length:216 start_codon:yes stop_codon:yes gene_type:complete
MLKLSDEALAAIMMALQKSLFEQSDIVPTLKGFNFKINEKEELFVMNPPIFKVPEEDDDGIYPFDENNGSD